MCTSMISRIPFRARTTVRGCLRSSKSSQSCSATDLSCHPGTDVCLLRVATLFISSIVGNVLAGRARMMNFTSVTSSYDCYLVIHGSPVTFCNESPSTAAVVVAPLRWSRPQTGFVAHRIVCHSYQRVSSSSVGRVCNLALPICIASSQFLRPHRLFHLRVVCLWFLSPIHVHSVALSSDFLYFPTGQHYTSGSWPCLCV